MTTYRLQAKSVLSAFGWRTVAEHETLEAMAAACDALAGEPDNQGLRRTDPTPCDYRVVDRSGVLMHAGHTRPDVLQRWSLLDSRARRGDVGEVGEGSEDPPT